MYSLPVTGVGVVTYAVLGVVAIVAGFVAKRRNRRNND